VEQQVASRQRTPIKLKNITSHTECYRKTGDKNILERNSFNWKSINHCLHMNLIKVRASGSFEQHHNNRIEKEGFLLLIYSAYNGRLHRVIVGNITTWKCFSINSKMTIVLFPVLINGDLTQINYKQWSAQQKYDKFLQHSVPIALHLPTISNLTTPSNGHFILKSVFCQGHDCGETHRISLNTKGANSVIWDIDWGCLVSAQGWMGGRIERWVVIRCE
jgi:hypothetical protein